MTEPNRACPICKSVGRDRNSDHMFQMSDGIRWSCRRTAIHPDGKVYYEGGSRDGEDVSGSGSSEGSYNGDVPDNDEMFRLLGVETPDDTALPISVPTEPGGLEIPGNYRGIYPSTFKKYKTTCSLASGAIAKLQHELRDTDGAYVVDKIRRVLPKKGFVCSGTTEGIPLQLFGMDIIPKAKRLLIVEGELDAMTAYQMLEKYKVAVWSLPLGANMKPLVDNLDKIQAFTKGNKELYFSLDMDDAGQNLVKKAASLFPSAKILKLDRKDANDYLEHPDGPAPEEFVSAFWDAEIYKPSTIVRVADIMEDILKKPVMGRPWPWPSLTKATYGRRDGEGMFVGAGVKLGKSEFINQVLAFDIQNKWPIASVKFEEQPAQTVKRVAGKIDGKFYHKPDILYEDSDLKSTVEAISPYLLLHQAFGASCNSRWDTCKEFIRYAVFQGSKTIIIDPITKITAGLTPSETETELRRFTDELASMAQDLGFFYIVTCHLKAANSGPAHERGGHVETHQFRGSRSMAEAAFYLLGIERNKDPELSEKERNVSTFVLLEDRAFGNVAKIPVIYSKVDQSYLEPTISSTF